MTPGLLEAFSYPPPQVERLCEMRGVEHASCARTGIKPARLPRVLPEALTLQACPDGVEQFVRDHLDGATAKEVSTKDGLSLTATTQQLQRHGARKP